jgi:hypothetical protein
MHEYVELKEEEKEEEEQQAARRETKGFKNIK